MDIKKLCNTLREPGARVGIGVWLMPVAYLGQEENVAVRLNVQPLDARQAYLDRLPPGASFSGLTRQNGYHNLVELMRDLSRNTHWRDCLLVHTLDLLLWALEISEREQFWREVLVLPYPSTKLILTIPESATELFSSDLHRQYQNQVTKGML